MLELREMGLDGFEAYYCEYDEREERYFLDLASRLNMIPSGGSDFHGTLKPDLELGKGRGKLNIPDQVLEQMEKAQNLKIRKQ